LLCHLKRACAVVRVRVRFEHVVSCGRWTR
jgi:hypothetical protein